MAIDAEGNYLTYNGTTNKWSSPASFDAAGAPEFVSCPSSSFCMAVDGSGNDLTWNGTIWSAATNFDGANMVTSVSCRASNFCIAVDDAGNAFTYNGSWTQPKDIDGTRELTAVSCNSSGFCVAVDNHGNAVIRSGGNWALPQGINGTTPLWGVSVVSSSFAVAVDEDGNALMYNGSSWSTTDVDGFEELQSASCTSTTFCAVVDIAGHAGFYSQSGTQQLIWDTAASEPLVLSDGTNYYVYGATGEPVEQVNVTASPPGNNPVFLTYTPSDSSWLATNTSGDELAFWRYDAFGTLALGTPDSPFGYAGQYTDTSSRVPSYFGNMRARWYQAQTGQFTSVDPDFGQSDQAYDYANDDPVNGVDPTGLCSLPGRFGFLYPGKCTHNPKLLREIAAGYAELGQLQKESGGGSSISLWDVFNWTVVAIVVVGTIPLDDTGVGEVADSYVFDRAVTAEDATAEEASESANAEDAADSDGPCGGQSFTAATEVRLANGTGVPIDQLKVGDKVLATDPKTGMTQAEPVTALWVNRDNDLLHIIVVAAGSTSTIDTTRHHLFYDLTTKHWAQADSLHAGDRLYTPGGTLVAVVATTVVPGSAYMWDLTVGKDHDFYVNMESTAVLVHNCPNAEPGIPKKPVSAYGKSQVPSWVYTEGYVPYEGESPVTTATRIMNEQYGEGNWTKGTSTEYNQLVKWATGHF
jgi:RHS repeat-associated protein